MRWPEFAWLAAGLLACTERQSRLSRHFFPPQPDPDEQAEMEEG